jgi:hypothetical protein
MSLGSMCALAQAVERDEPAFLANAPEPQTAAHAQPSVEQPTNPPTSADEQKKAAPAVQRSARADQNTGYVSGTVTDTNGDMVPGATITLDGPQDHRTAKANELGAFQFDGVKPGVQYQITIEAHDLDSWKSEPITLEPGQYFYLKDIKLKVPDLVTSVTVYATQEQIAAQQVELETKQRVFGFIPNFYVTYEKDPVPLSTKLKFKLALKADTDVMTFVGVAFMAAIYQAGDVPNYGQGWDAYAKRLGAGYGDTTTDIFFGGAIYPWLFRQDPRYFYKGTGTVKSRILHAMGSPYICKGDNGKTQPNFSSLGGDLTSGAISNLYYPESNRGASLVFEGFAITTGVRTVNGLLQEFLIRKLTPSARAKN